MHLPPSAQIDLDLALRLARRAVYLAVEPNADHLALLARVQFKRGELGEAIRLQQEAAAAAPDAERAPLEATLEEYEAAHDPAG